MVSLCACDLATHGPWFVDIRCANILSFFPPPLLALAAFFYVIVIMAFFCSHLYWAEYVSDRNCNILINIKLINGDVQPARVCFSEFLS